MSRSSITTPTPATRQSPSAGHRRQPPAPAELRHGSRTAPTASAPSLSRSIRPSSPTVQPAASPISQAPIATSSCPITAPARHRPSSARRSGRSRPSPSPSRSSPRSPTPTRKVSPDIPVASFGPGGSGTTFDETLSNITLAGFANQSISGLTVNVNIADPTNGLGDIGDLFIGLITPNTHIILYYKPGDAKLYECDVLGQGLTNSRSRSHPDPIRTELLRATTRSPWPVAAPSTARTRSTSITIPTSISEPS